MTTAVALPVLIGHSTVAVFPFSHSNEKVFITSAFVEGSLKPHFISRITAFSLFSTMKINFLCTLDSICSLNFFPITVTVSFQVTVVTRDLYSATKISQHSSTISGTQRKLER